MQNLSDFLATHANDKALRNTISAITHCCSDIATLLQGGSLAGILGSTNDENVQGETQKKLDVIANDLLKKALLSCDDVGAIASEEEDQAVISDKKGALLVTFDPLDGSSNIDINSMVGTIFSVLQTPTPGSVKETDFLQAGKNQHAAGYVLYGPSVMLALSVGSGTHFFTLDQVSKEFLLTGENISIDQETQEFAINMSNQRHWTTGMQNYIADLLLGKEGPRQKNFNMRWVAAMVADVHRVLSRGGIFAYPWDKRDPNKPGKLRLMYEANPMAMLVEQAGGAAHDGAQTILEIEPNDIHQRVPVILGSAKEVSSCLSYLD